MIFFNIFAKKIDCGYTLELTRLYFGIKNKKKYKPLYIPILLYEVGIKGVFKTRTCYFDDENILYFSRSVYKNCIRRTGFNKGKNAIS